MKSFYFGYQCPYGGYLPAKIMILTCATSEGVVFRNGPVDWFEKKGFADKGVLMMEKLHEATIHYLQLDLTNA